MVDVEAGLWRSPAPKTTIRDGGSVYRLAGRMQNWGQAQLDCEVITDRSEKPRVATPEKTRADRGGPSMLRDA